MKKSFSIALAIPLLFLLLSSLPSCVSSKRRSNLQQLEEQRYVVVLSLDGFRADYPTLANTPTIDSLARVGTSAAFQPCFPSLTFPNHYSMATGLYPDHHGIVSNRFQDKELGEFRISKRTAVEDGRFWLGEPIWNTAERQGIKSAVFYWVGSEAKVNGMQASRWKKYSKKLSYRSRVDSVIGWLKLPVEERPRLLMFYIEEPDETGHKYTPESKELRAKVEELDAVLAYFFSQMKQLDYADKIDFLLVSDHGMATYKPEHIIDLNQYLPRDSFDFVDDGAYVQLQPKPSYREQAYRLLKQVPRCKVYYKEDLPKRFHAGKSSRLAEILLLPDVGSYVYFRKRTRNELAAAHGYDNEAREMQAIFRAVGPSFEKGKQFASIPNITLYPLICQLLGIEAAPNDADARVARRLIKSKSVN